MTLYFRQLLIILATWIVILLCIILLTSHFARADQEERCYQQAFGQFAFPKPIKARSKIVQAKTRCRSFSCFAAQAPDSRDVLLVYINKRSRSRTHWGNLGWAAHNVAVVKRRKQIENALLLARGVELSRLLGKTEGSWSLEELIAGDLYFHDQVASEIRCLTRHGIQSGYPSFDEISRVPNPK